MPFRDLIDSGSFAPEALQVMYEAFDLAWREVAADYEESESRAAFARDTLARAVFMVSERAPPDDADALKTAALEVFQRMINPSAG